jgi:hypothetical protein
LPLNTTSQTLSAAEQKLNLNGKTFIIKSPTFDLMISPVNLSLVTDFDRLSSSNNRIVLLKCLMYLLTIPEDGLAEAAEELEGIHDFYRDRPSGTEGRTIEANRTIQVKLQPPQVRGPIVLDS